MDNLDKWVEYLKDEEKSKYTISSYITDVSQFTKFIDKDITEVNKDDIEAFKNDLKAKKDSDGKVTSINTINRKLVSINQFIAYLNNELGKTVNIKIKQEKMQQQDYLENVITKGEFDRLVAEAEKEKDFRAIAIFYGLFLTGMRVSELLQLKVSDVCKDSVMIKGKGSKHRYVYFSDRLNAIFNEYLLHRIQRQTEFLFTSSTSNIGVLTRSTIDIIIKKHGLNANIDKDKLHAHSFRHLFCKELIDKKISIDTVADLAGHSSINTTRIYTRKTKSELLSTINSL